MKIKHKPWPIKVEDNITMKTYKIPFDLTYIGHSSVHEDCVANVTVRIPTQHIEAVLDPEHTLEYNPQEWVIAAIEIEEDTKAFLSTTFANEPEMCLAVLHFLMKDLDAFDELVAEYLWENKS